MDEPPIDAEIRAIEDQDKSYEIDEEIKTLRHMVLRDDRHRLVREQMKKKFDLQRRQSYRKPLALLTFEKAAKASEMNKSQFNVTGRTNNSTSDLLMI